MYASDIAASNKLAQAAPDGMARMLRFVLATIQQQLETVPDILRDFERNGHSSKFAFGPKAAGLRYIEENSERIFREASAAKHDEIALMRVFLQVPGLGLVKAGFACQLFAGIVGCLDVHNVRMYGVTRKVLRIDKGAMIATIVRRIKYYCDLCRKLGGSLILWAAWCEYKASLNPFRWASGREVSKLHVTLLEA